MTIYHFNHFEMMLSDFFDKYKELIEISYNDSLVKATIEEHTARNKGVKEKELLFELFINSHKAKCECFKKLCEEVNRQPQRIVLTEENAKIFKNG